MTVNIPNNCEWVLNITLLGILYALFNYTFKINRMYVIFPKMVAALNRISEALMQKGIAKTPFFNTASPLKLTDAGNKLIEEVKFLDFYNINNQTLLHRIREKNPTTMADIEEAAKAIMVSLEDTLPGFEFLKQYAYQHGEPLADILFICAIKLRDLAAIDLKITS